MPRRTDVQSILILGSGSIVIGQAAELDHSAVPCAKRDIARFRGGIHRIRT